MNCSKETFDDDSKRKAVDMLRKCYHQDPGDYDDPGKRKRVIHAASLKIFATNHVRWGVKKLKKMYDREEKTQFGTKRRIFSGVVVKDTSQGRGARTDFTSNADFGEQDVPKNEIAPSKPKSIIDGDKGQDGGTNSNSTSNDNNNAGNGSSTTTNVNLAKNEALQQVVSEISLKRKRAMGEQVTMRERLEARRKAMMNQSSF